MNMIKYICNACGRVVKDIEAETLAIYKGSFREEYIICPTCSEAIKKTREEAIKELELIAEVTVWKERREAVEMAIEALKQEPVKHGECVSNITTRMTQEYVPPKKELSETDIVKEFENVFRDRRAISLDEIKSTIRGLFE